MRNPISQLNFLFFSTLMAILIWMASPGVKAATEPFPLVPYEARYDILWHGLKAGESVHKLIRKNDSLYYFESKTFPSVSLVPYSQFESATFTWQDGNIKPLIYSCDIKEGKRHRIGKVSFNWNDLIVHNNLPQRWQTALTAGTQDKITQTLSLRQALKKGSRDLKYQVAELDKLKDYHFVMLGPERVRTKMGFIDTLKLQHTSRKGYETIMWLAIKFDYLPVKMQQTRHNKVVASGVLISYTPQISRD